jgi:hypothetical protein
VEERGWSGFGRVGSLRIYREQPRCIRGPLGLKRAWSALLVGTAPCSSCGVDTTGGTVPKALLDCRGRREKRSQPSSLRNQQRACSEPWWVTLRRCRQAAALSLGTRASQHTLTTGGPLAWRRAPSARSALSSVTRAATAALTATRIPAGASGDTPVSDRSSLSNATGDGWRSRLYCAAASAPYLPAGREASQSGGS